MSTSLNKDQQLAVDCRDERILCLAGPGAGKTFTMLARISHLMKEGIPASSILVLTFTNAAAFEMKERFRRNNPTARCPEFRTFHAFCYYLISHDRGILNKLGYSKVPSICTESQERKIMAEVAMKLGIKLTKKQIDGKDPLVTREDRFQFELLMKATQKKMDEDNVITFDRMCYGICSLFEKQDELTTSYRLQYRYIFVDEFQDTDPKQWRFVKSFEDSRLFLVADALQAIYGFRGADSSIVKSISADKSWTVIKLHNNYRSTKQICDYINSISTYADDDYRIIVESDKEGPSVQIKNVWMGDSYGEYSRDILDMMFEYLLQHTDKGTTAILLRTNSEVSYVGDYLHDKGFDFITGRRNEEAINSLRAVFDNEYLMDWLSANLNNDDYAQYIRLSSLKEDYDINDFWKDFQNTSVIRNKGTKVMSVRKILSTPEVELGASPQSVIDDIRKVLKIRKKLKGPEEACTPREIVSHMLSLLDVDEDGSTYLGTIHSSKGLEYDTVIVLGAGGKSFNLYNEENKNIYYVAVSRAKTNLFVIKERNS